MTLLELILLILAVVAFAAAATRFVVPKLEVIAVGLACFAGYFLALKAASGK